MAYHLDKITYPILLTPSRTSDTFVVVFGHTKSDKNPNSLS